MRIIVDAMGGDNAPESAVWGGALAAKEYGEEVLLVGKPEVVANVLKEKGLSEVKGITIKLLRLWILCIRTIFLLAYPSAIQARTI